MVNSSYVMDEKEFYNFVKENIMEQLPDDFRDAAIRVDTVTKSNGVERTGISIRKQGESVTPMIYMEEMYKDYLEGKPAMECIQDIVYTRVNIARDNIGTHTIESIRDYENVKDKLQIRICDPEWNVEKLKNLVTTQCGDFAAYYSVNLHSGPEGVASLNVSTALLASWEVTPEQLHLDALAADRTMEPRLCTMEDIMNEMFFGEGKARNNLLVSDTKADPEIAEDFVIPVPDPEMYVLTNRDAVHGAGLLTHEEIRGRIAEVTKGDFYVLPSSVHEVLILPADHCPNVSDLNDMVKEVNETVDMNDRLSDKVQFCDAKTLKLENAEKHIRDLEQQKAAKLEPRDYKIERKRSR